MGFEGPYAGGKHQIMQKGTQTIRVPNPNRADISAGLLARILRDSGIDRAEWGSCRLPVSGSALATFGLFQPFSGCRANLDIFRVALV